MSYCNALSCLPKKVELNLFLIDMALYSLVESGQYV